MLKTSKSMVQNDPKLSDDSVEGPKPNRVVGGSIPGHEIVFLLDEKLTRWSSASCVPKRKKKRNERKKDFKLHREMVIVISYKPIDKDGLKLLKLQVE